MTKPTLILLTVVKTALYLQNKFLKRKISVKVNKDRFSGIVINERIENTQKNTHRRR